MVVVRVGAGVVPAAGRGEQGRVRDLVYDLQLGEVVAAADRAEADVALALRQREALAPWRKVAPVRPIETVELLGPAVELELAGGEVRRPEAHGATDVVAGEMRVDHVVRDEGGADRHALARVEVGEAGGMHDAVEPGRVLELLEGGALDPGLVGGEETDVAGFSG